MFRSYVQPAIRTMLIDLDKLNAKQIICASHDGPAVSGLTAVELVQKYDNFDKGFLDLKDDPLNESEACPDLISLSGPVAYDPSEAISFTQFVLQNVSNEIKNPFALEIYARPIDFDIHPIQQLVKVLISIPAFIIDAVPDAPTGDEIQEQALKTNSEVELDIKEIYGKITRLKFALLVYSKYQSYFYQTQNGFVKFKESGKDYYCSSFVGKINSFYDELKQLAKDKRWNIRSNIPSITRKNADKLRIQFINGPDGNPYRIKRIDVKIEGCEYQRLCGRDSKFAQKYSRKPTLMNYIAKLKEIDVALQARESYPWLDFTVKFTYPLLTVDYGTLNEEAVKDSMGECVSNNVQDFGGELKDYILNEALSFMEAMAYEFNSKQNCRDLLAESEIEKKYFNTPRGKGLEAKSAVKEKQETDSSNVEELDAESRKLFSLANIASREKAVLENRPLTPANKKEIEKIEKKISDLLTESSRLNEKIAYIDIDMDVATIDKIQRDNAKQKAKNAKKKEGSPYWKDAKKLALEELKTQDTLLSSLVDIEVFMTTGAITSPKANKTDSTKLLQKMTLCNTKSLATQAIRCLFSGVTQESAFKKMVEAAIKAMDIDILGMFIGALPPDKQAEIRKMAKEKWADMPMPWEEGYSGGSSEKANPYLSYLGTNKGDVGVKAEISKIKEDAAKIDLEINEKSSEIKTLESALDVDISSNIKPSEELNDEQQFQANVETEKIQSEYLTALNNLAIEKQALESKSAQMQANKRAKLEELGEFPLDPVTGEPLPFSALPEEKQKELIDSQTQAQGTFGKALGDIQAEIVDMYIKNILDVMEVDELLSILDKFPGGALVQRYVNKVSCSFQGLHNPPIKSFLSGLSFDPCGEGNLGLGVPSKMRDFNMRDLKPWKKDFLKILRNKFIDKLEATLTQILVRMILKLIKTVDDALCKSIGAIGKAAAALVTGGAGQGLDEAFKDAFCPDADDDELDEIKNKAFDNALGKTGLQGAPPAAYDCLFEIMNATMSKQDVIGLLTETPSNMDEGIVLRMSQLVNARCPELSPALGDPEDIKDAFGSMQKFIPPELRKFLKDQSRQQPEGPIFDSICLTQAELDKWNDDRKKLYISNGLDEETAQELIDKANDRALDDLGTVADMLQKGPEGLMAEALDDLLNQGDPGCETDPSAIVLEDDDLAAEKLDLLNDFFKTIEKKFIRDLIGGKHAILSNVLVDSHGNRLNKHRRRVNTPLVYPSYVDSEEQLENRKENNPFQVGILKGAFEFPHSTKRMKGEFPKTIGGAMLERIKKMNLKYNSKDEFNVVMKFEDKSDDPEYESKLKFKVINSKTPSTRIVVDETFHRKMSKEEKRKLGLEGVKFGSLDSLDSTRIRHNQVIPEKYTLDIDYSIFKENYNIETVLFRNLLMEKSGILLGNSTLSKIQKVTDIWNLKTLSVVRKAVTEDPRGNTPSGFSFGADEQQKIKFQDLLYVNPDADPEDRLTWRYTNLPWDKVLGKSATEHPRVHFLDPASHGGSYLFPKIYVEPATYNGWLGMYKTFIPETEVCDDADNGFLQINDISRRAKKVEGSLPIDKRISQDPECRFEIPYDRQLEPANHGLIEGIIIATIRTFGTEFILRTMPMLGSIRLSADNYDGSLFLTMAQKMEQEFGADSEWELNVVKSYTYYLLFLEQSVQVVQRQIKDGLMKETDEIKAASRKISRAQNNFERTTTMSPTVLDQISKGSAIAGWNYEWETRYENANLGAKFQKLLRFLSPFKLSLSRKLAVIHDTKEHAQVFLAALLQKEMSSLTKRIEQNLRPVPHVFDIKRYLLSKSGVLSFSDIRSGETIIERQTIEGGNRPDYGIIRNCPSEIAVGGHSQPMVLPEEGIMFLEKFVRTISKEGVEQVMTTDEFKQLVSSSAFFDQNLKISDYFGNASILNGEFVGTIGVKFGVRLIFIPSHQMGISSNLDTSSERVGLIGPQHHIPLVSYEHDVLDKMLKHIDFDDDNIGEDLKCYVDNLSNEDDFKLLFETVIKSTAFTSMFGIYSYYNFFECIGVGPDEVEEDRQDNIKNKWKRKVFDDTKRILKKQFRSTYRSDDSDAREDRNREKRQFDAKFVGNLLPGAYLGLDSSIRWWQSFRIVDQKPFDANGEECKNDFQKLFED